MNIFTALLLSSLRLAFFGVLKVALSIYILFLSDSPLGGAASDDDGRTRDTASNAAHEASVTPTSLGRNAFSS